MYRNDQLNPKKRALEKRDPIRNKIPEKPIKQGPGSRLGLSYLNDINILIIFYFINMLVNLYNRFVDIINFMQIL